MELSQEEVITQMVVNRIEVTWAQKGDDYLVADYEIATRKYKLVVRQLEQRSDGCSWSVQGAEDWTTMAGFKNTPAQAQRSAEVALYAILAIAKI